MSFQKHVYCITISMVQYVYLLS